MCVRSPLLLASARLYHPQALYFATFDCSKMFRIQGIIKIIFCIEINKIAFAQGSHLVNAVLYELNMFHIRALKEYLNFCNKTNKFTCKKHVLSHIINYINLLIYIFIFKCFTKY
jgi:hypothetical protein